MSEFMIFTTGAFLIPYQLKDGNWGWLVSGFEDDSFEEYNGDIFNPKEYAVTLEDLINSGKEEI